MHTIRDDFAEKRSEAEILISHIEELTLESGSINKVSILKSAFIMLLYNVVESTTVLVLDRVHEKASRHQYSELSEHFKKLFVEHYLHGESQTKQKVSLNKIIDNSLTFPAFDDLSKKINLFSGNLDARELSKILSRYGIGKVTSKNKEKLLIVKSKRNKIAHGEVMFKECCRNSTAEELVLIKTAVFDALSQMVSLTDKFFEQKRYLKH